MLTMQELRDLARVTLYTTAILLAVLVAARLVA